MFWLSDDFSQDFIDMFPAVIHRIDLLERTMVKRFSMFLMLGWCFIQTASYNSLTQKFTVFPVCQAFVILIDHILTWQKAIFPLFIIRVFRVENHIFPTIPKS
jgi:hypothetical protein